MPAPGPRSSHSNATTAEASTSKCAAWSRASRADTSRSCAVSWPPSSMRRHEATRSIVRRLVFGPEDQFRRFLGGYLAGAALPNYLGLDGRMVVWNAPRRLAAIYPVHQTTTARAGFLFRRREEFVLDYRDVEGQKQALHQVYGGDGWHVPRLLAEM